LVLLVLTGHRGQADAAAFALGQAGHLVEVMVGMSRL
jgi:hypothetical protein